MVGHFRSAEQGLPGENAILTAPAGVDAASLRDEARVGAYDLFMLTFSAYALGALVASVMLPEDSLSRGVLEALDNAACAVFFADFLRNLLRAERKLEYMRWGWLDLLASIPAVDALRFARLARVLRIIRVLRGFRSARHVAAVVLQRRAQSAFWGMALACIAILVGSAIAIVELESGVPGANITTAGDAVWWAYVTMSTVGYGDRYPVTAEGRIVAVVLMAVGVGLFGTFTAYVASWFHRSTDRLQNREIAALERRVKRLEAVVVAQVAIDSAPTGKGVGPL
jgi:voltage-gated potassium channel